MRNLARAVLVMVAMAATPACAHFRVAPEGLSASTVEEKRKVHAMAWGAFEPRIAPANCRGNGLASVTVKMTLLGAIGTVGTLGFWTPLHVEWTCAGDNAGTGR